MRSVRWAAVPAAVLAVVAAGSVTALALSRPAADSGIEGRVVPCGIVLERAAPCATASQRMSLAVGQGERVLRRAKVGERGWFRVPLEPGRYWLQPRMGAVLGPRARANVSAGRWTNLAIPAGRVAPPRGA